MFLVWCNWPLKQRGHEEPSFSRQCTALKIISWCCARCASRYPSRSNLSPVHRSAASHYISSFLSSAAREMNPSDYHSTGAQMTLKHKTDRHTGVNIDSPFSIICRCTALRHMFLFLPPLLLPPAWKFAAILDPIVTSVSAVQGKKIS